MNLSKMIFGGLGFRVCNPLKCLLRYQLNKNQIVLYSICSYGIVFTN
jgi:hypothetical protein